MDRLTINSTVELSNSVKMPLFGFGAAEIASREKDQTRIVRTAIEAGYRLLDTAAFYHTENGVGNAIKESGVDREKLFVTTKIWTGDARDGRAGILRSFEESLRRLKLDYVDLLIFHWPVQGKLVDTWKAMEDIYYSGRARALGLSNVKRYHHIDLIQNCDVPCHVQQDEFKPNCMNNYNKMFCEAHGIHFEAFSPLSRTAVMGIPLIRQLAEKYGKNPAQVVLRWDIQHGVTTIPRSSSRDHIYSNTEIFDFELTDDEMKAIDALNTEARDNCDPDNFNF